MNKLALFGVLGLVLLVTLSVGAFALDSGDVEIPNGSDSATGPVGPSESTPVDGTGATQVGTVADPVEEAPTEPVVESSPSAGSQGGGQCKSPWSCSDWGDCAANGLQTRICNKENPSCTAIGVKPSETQTCTVPAQILNAQTAAAGTAEGTATGEQAALGQAPITGAVTGTGASRNFWIAGVFILAIAVAGMLVWRRNKARVSK